MSHVSSGALRRFIARGEASAHFEAHVDACERCARALCAAARASLEPPASSAALALRFLPLEGWLAFAMLVLVLLVWPRPVSGAPQLSFTSTSLSLSAGVPDAGPADGPLPPLLLASYDAGETRD